MDKTLATLAVAGAALVLAGGTNTASAQAEAAISSRAPRRLA